MQEASRPFVPILIPAYMPGEPFLEVVRSLLGLGAAAIIVVDDGSGPEYGGAFRAAAADPRVHLVQHAVNLGKGAALKTGMNYALTHFPACAGVVTADADGQHHPEDILRVAELLAAHSGSLILGVRAWDSGVPARSKLGNELTRALMRVVMGQALADTQTGLRGVPASLIPHLLRLASSGYEFELDMLMACKYQRCPIVQEQIRTIYQEGNKSSHFRPVMDSMRIYFLLFRFSVLSLLTAVIDNAVFATTFVSTGSIGLSQIFARLVAMVFNYLGARSVVFHSRQKHAVVLPKYVFLVFCNGVLSYALIQLLHTRLGMRAIPAKLLAEGLLFIANFAIQRDFVFTRRAPMGRATDWDSYYTAVPATAKLTRRYTTAVLRDGIKRYAAPASGAPALSVVEIGGANSCFLDQLMSAVNCRSYDVVDTNPYGLSLLAKRVGSSTAVRLHEQSVLSMSLDVAADVVFSVGLVEHFDPAETREAVAAHFSLLRPGGIVILSFPTPTLLYRIARRLIEMVGMWKFPDERPLRREEVAATVQEHGDILYEKTLWPLILTQHFIVARKREEGPGN